MTSGRVELVDAPEQFLGNARRLQKAVDLVGTLPSALPPESTRRLLARWALAEELDREALQEQVARSYRSLHPSGTLEETQRQTEILLKGLAQVREL